MRLECKRQWTWEVAWCSELLKKPFLQLFLQLFDLIVQNIEAVITAICWCLSNFILFGCLSPMVDVARSINFGACPSFHPWPTIFHFSRYHPFHFLNNVVLFPLWIFSSLLRKNCFSFRFVQSPPPTPPQFGQLVQLFSDVEVQNLKDSLWLKPAYVIYIIPYIYHLKNSLKFKLMPIIWKK